MNQSIPPNYYELMIQCSALLRFVFGGLLLFGLLPNKPPSMHASGAEVRMIL